MSSPRESIMLKTDSRNKSRPNDNSKYKDVAYWNNRYINEETYEWCKSYKYFKHLITDYVDRNNKILILGCGNSKLSEDLYNDGYRNITNIDFASTALENEVSKSNSHGMSYIVMDIRRLTFIPGSFDVILEKATLDSLLVDEKDPWNLSKKASLLLKGILTQISTLLNDGGRFISLTFAQPHFRRKMLSRSQYKWSVKHFTYGDGFHFFFYVMTKGESCGHGHESGEEEEEEEPNRHTELATNEGSSDDGEDFIYKISDEV